MRKIIKSPPPQKLTTYRLIRNVDDNAYRPSYSDIDKDVYDDALESLLNEQGWICGYCQQKISDIDTASIEHHCEQTICNGNNGTVDKSLDYRNMIAVCPGKLGTTLFCDKKKATFNINNGLPMDISPLILSHTARIKYSSTGIIKSTNDLHNDELNNILNLNSKILKNRRSKKYSLFLSISGNPAIKKNRDKLERLLRRDLIFGNNKFSNSFPGMSEYMLGLFCKKP